MYAVFHTESHRVYVGKANDPSLRWKQHVSSALRGDSWCPHFYAAIRKYGIEGFSFSIFQECQNEDQAFEVEKMLIEDLKSFGLVLFNISAGGRGGRKFSDKQRQTHSEIQKKWANEPEARARNSSAQLKVSERKSQKMKIAWESNIEYAKNVRAKLKSEKNRKLHARYQSEAWANPEQRKKMLEGMRRPDVVLAMRARSSNENNPRAKLTWELVDQMRKDANELSVKELMEKYKLSYCTIRRVILNKAWVRN